MTKGNAIVFDWNGTLFADTRHAWRATNHTLKLFNCKPVSLDHYRNSWAVPISDLYIALGCNAQELFERQKELYDVWHDMYESRAKLARLRRGARKVLQTLNEQQFDVLILSNHTKVNISVHTQRLGIHGMFSTILANDDPRRNFTNRDKSDRLKKYLETSNTQQALLVGDTIEEIEIARHHGVVSVAVTHGQCTTRNLRVARPDFLISNLNEVPAIAERVFAVKHRGRG
jgi:phosphoglycolate phosphatase-like HAD superfamily hydrolase